MLRFFQVETGITFNRSYLTICFVVVAVGILAAIRLNQISTTVSNLTNNLASDIVLSMEMSNQVLLARLSANRFIRTHGQVDLDRFQSDYVTLEAMLARAEQQITDPEQVVLLGQIKTGVRNYGATFNDVSELLGNRDRIQSQILDVQGLLIENNLTALRIRVVSQNEPMAFLAISNAFNAFQLMRLNSAHFYSSGDERYAVLFESAYRQVKASFVSLDKALQYPAKHKNLSEAVAAADRYHQGFQTIHTGHLEFKDILKSKLDALEIEISNLASAVVTDIEQEFDVQNAFLKTLILQTRMALVVTSAFALLAGLGLTVVINRRLADRERANLSLREARDRLEMRVAERTLELTKTNAQLQEEITERVQTGQALQAKNEQLIAALSEVKRLNGLLPICASCKKIRDDTGYWHQIEVYIREHSDADFSHGICPECKIRLYPELYNT